MLGVGWTEMLVIGVVALIVIGPKDLPMLMQRLGKAIGSIRRMGADFQRELNKTTGLDQITDLRRSITEPLKKTTAEITREFNKITPTGVAPSGAIKPADPKAESVVAEIQAATGIAPASPAAPVMTAQPRPEPAAAVKSDVATKPKRPRTRKVESPAPVEAIAPAAAAASKPAAKKSAAKKSAAKKATVSEASPAAAATATAKPRTRSSRPKPDAPEAKV